ncbi:MAG: sulfatase-like hydrolase/transferase [Planctomycetota bacterium]|nr:sulfatase-like hydrolase/transferase [Planctomycetota bacterium]
MSGNRKTLFIVLVGCGVVFALVGLGCLAILFVMPAATSEAVEDDSPYLRWETAIVIAIDDLRADHLKCYGYELDTTPNITRLAEDGIVFDEFVTSCTATNPAVATLLTGMVPAQHGLASVREVGRHRLPEAALTMPELLAMGECRSIAAVSLRQLEGRLSGLDQGFEVYLDDDLPRSGRPKPAAEVLAALEPELRRMLAGDGYVFAFVHLGDLRAEADRNVGERTEFLREHLGPFAEEDPAIESALASMDPVAELETILGRQRGSPEWVALRNALYDARLLEVDRVVGEILALLEEEGRSERAFVGVVGTRGRYLVEDRPDGPQEGFSEALLRTGCVFRFSGPMRAFPGFAETADFFGIVVTAFDLGIDGTHWLDEIAYVSGPGLRECALVDRDSKTVFRPSRWWEGVTFDRSDRVLDGPLPEALEAHAFQVAPLSGLRVDVAGGLERAFELRVVSAERDVARIEVYEGEDRVRWDVRQGSGELSFGPGVDKAVAVVETAARDPHLLLELTTDGGLPEVRLPTGAFLPEERVSEVVEPEGESIVDVRRVEGLWFELTVAGEGESARAHVVRHPPRRELEDLESRVLSEGGRALWKASGLGAQVFEGPLPLVVRFRLGASELPAVAVEVDGVRVPVERMRFEGRPFAHRKLRVVIPKWSGGGPAELREQDPTARLIVTRMPTGARMEGPLDLEPDDVAFLQRLGSNE